MLEEIGAVILEEFSDVPDVESVMRIVLRLLIAGILGGLLGYERERRGKSAGIRTHMLVAVGAAIFILVPQQAGASINDITRVLQGVIQGVGFLGAGAIIVGNATEKSRGLTTAAGVWVTAGIGMVAGLGMLTTAILSTLVVLLILLVAPLLAKRVIKKDSA